MISPVQILWTPAGVTMPSLGTKMLVDITDGDTPNVRMPIRMLSIDTPEVTARNEQGAQRVDGRFAQLAEWLTTRSDLPVSRRFADYLIPKISTGQDGTLHFQQGSAASRFAKDNATQRLTRHNGTQRSLFIRTIDQPFDNNGRLLPYVAPNYSKAERETMSRRDRSTFNLDMVRSGWAAPFPIYPSIPGELDLPMLLTDAATAADPAQPLGIWAHPLTLPAYEYRAVEKLFGIAEDIVAERPVSQPYGWRDRYCVDMRTRLLYGPEDYFDIDPVYRLWIWSADVAEAVSRLNLTPSPRLVGAE